TLKRRLVEGNWMERLPESVSWNQFCRDDLNFSGEMTDEVIASVLQEGRENANIDAGLGFNWRISVYWSAQRCRNCACCPRPSPWLPLPRSPRNLPTTPSRHQPATVTGSMSTR